MINAIKDLKDDGIDISKEDMENLSPYLTSHIKRFGEYTLDLDGESEPISKYIAIDVRPIKSTLFLTY
jgi:hypothetical protein